MRNGSDKCWNSKNFLFITSRIESDKLPKDLNMFSQMNLILILWFQPPLQGKGATKWMLCRLIWSFLSKVDQLSFLHLICVLFQSTYKCFNKNLLIDINFYSQGGKTIDSHKKSQKIKIRGGYPKHLQVLAEGCGCWRVYVGFRFNVSSSTGINPKFDFRF